MSIWGTNYTVGDVVATALASYIIGHVSIETAISADGTEVAFANWRWVFWSASIVLTLISVIVFILFRNKPEDVGLPKQSKKMLIKKLTCCKTLNLYYAKFQFGF